MFQDLPKAGVATGSLILMRSQGGRLVPLCPVLLWLRYSTKAEFGIG